MTDMPERMGAQERIWLPEDETLYLRSREEADDVEYIRADLVPQWSSDMDAAPKDGTFFLMRRKMREPVVVNQPPGCARGIWHKWGKEWFGNCHGGDEADGWMPLPEAPE